MRHLFSIVAFLIANVLAAQSTGSRLDELAEAYVKKGRNPGLMVAIVQDGEATYRAYGQRSRQDGLPPDEYSLYEIGALSGVFTTTLMVQEALAGKFDIGESVREYFPEGIPPPTFQPRKCVEVVIRTETSAPAKRIISCTPDPLGREACVAFCDLATHSSGLPNSGIGLYDWHPIGLVNRLQGPEPEFSKAQFYQKLAEIPPQAPPGSEYRFSNVGIALIGHLLAEMNQEAFGPLLESRLLHPLGMRDTRLALTAEQNSRLLPGHDDKGRAVPHWSFNGMAPAAGLKSSAHDLALFLRANLQEGRSAQASLMEQVQQARIDVHFPALTRSTQAGYGWLISILSPETNQPVLWMYGGTAGFRAFMGFIKDARLGVVVLSNSANDIRELSFEMLEELYRQNGRAARN